MSNRTSEPRRALVLVGRGNAAPAYEAAVELDRGWVHLRDVVERVSGYHQRRGDRTLRANNVEIRWIESR